MNIPRISLAGKNGVALALVLVGVALLIISKWLGGWFAFIGIVIILGAILDNAIVQIEGGTAGAQKVFGAPVRRALKPGWCFILPFFTEVKIITTKHLPHKGAALDVETNEGFKIGIEHTIFRGFIPELVWHFVSDIEEPFDENYLDIWLREIFQNLVRTHSSKEIQEQPAIALALQEEIKKRFYDEIEDRMFQVCGETIVKNVQVVFGNYIYDPKFLKLQEDLRNANNQALIAEQQKKATITKAEALKESLIKEAEGKAEATRLNGDADAAATRATGKAKNEVLDERGRILTEKPAITHNDAAQRPPETLVLGAGVSPVMDINKKLYPVGEDTTSSSTQATSTPTSTATAGAAAGANVNINVNPTPPTP